MSTHDMDDAQTLCDRILLIDRGRRLIYGAVDDVRRSFSDGAVEVVGRNLPVADPALASVDHATAYDGRVRYLLREGATAQQLFREIAATDATVERFSIDAPNLAEIFVRAVSGEHGAIAPSERAA
jgi:ABC-2 type transport system ATP-binding protein